MKAMLLAADRASAADVLKVVKSAVDGGFFWEQDAVEGVIKLIQGEETEHPLYQVSPVFGAIIDTATRLRTAASQGRGSIYDEGCDCSAEMEEDGSQLWESLEYIRDKMVTNSVRVKRSRRLFYLFTSIAIMSAWMYAIILAIEADSNRIIENRCDVPVVDPELVPCSHRPTVGE